MDVQWQGSGNTEEGHLTNWEHSWVEVDMISRKGAES